VDLGCPIQGYSLEAREEADECVDLSAYEREVLFVVWATLAAVLLDGERPDGAVVFQEGSLDLVSSCWRLPQHHLVFDRRKP